MSPDLIKHLVEAFIALFVVVDPFSTVCIFSTLAVGMTAAQQRRIAIKATFVSAVIIVFFIVLGQLIFDHMKVNLHAFTAAGGLVLLLFSIEMVLGSHEPPDASKTQHTDISIFPLALPCIAGPGTIMVAILQTDNDVYSVYEQGMVTLVAFVVLAINFVFLWFAPYINRVLGRSGSVVLTQILGLILAAISVQAIFSGIAGFFHLRVG